MNPNTCLGCFENMINSSPTAFAFKSRGATTSQCENLVPDAPLLTQTHTDTPAIEQLKATSVLYIHSSPMFKLLSQQQQHAQLPAAQLSNNLNATMHFFTSSSPMRVCLYPTLLAPTGALIVMLVYYSIYNVRSTATF